MVQNLPDTFAFSNFYVFHSTLLDMSLKGIMKNSLTLLSTEEKVGMIYARLFLLSFGEDLLASLIGFLTFV